MTARVVPLQGLLLERVHAIDAEPDYTAETDRELTRDIDAATVLTSRVDPGGPHALDPNAAPVRHKVVLDIDFPAQLIPSSTPGHFHLLIDKELTWGQYTGLLHELARVGILQDGYVSASITRGHTAVRLPWIKKETPA